MSRITTVKYDAEYNPSQEQATLDRLGKMEEMKLAGKTDGVSYYNGLRPPAAIYQRSWTTEADAQEWIDFITPLGHIDYARIEPDGATWTDGFVLWTKS